MKLAEKTLVITGAASGIGRALALECTKRGMSIAICDRDTEGLEETRAEAVKLAGNRTKVSAHELDVSSLDAWQDTVRDIKSVHGAVDGIINNAGIAFSGTIEDTSYEKLDQVMSINFLGMAYGTKELLPMLKARPEAVIANVSSVFGLFPMKRNGAYCASKFAIRGLTETLAQELRGTKVTVTSIHPGHIGTDIVTNVRKHGNMVGSDLDDAAQQELAKEFKDKGLAPEKAAQIILDGIVKNKRRILVGNDAVWMDRLIRLLPNRVANMINDRMPLSD